MIMSDSQQLVLFTYNLFNYEKFTGLPLQYNHHRTVFLVIKQFANNSPTVILLISKHADNLETITQLFQTH